MPTLLTKPEINARMVAWRNLKLLHARAVAKIATLEILLRQKDEQLTARDTRITELEHALNDKEAQRKALSTKLWKAKKDRSAEQTEQTGTNKSGAQAGHEARRRPLPVASDVTDRQIFDLAKCPACKQQVGEAVDTVERYTRNPPLPESSLIC